MNDVYHHSPAAIKSGALFCHGLRSLLSSTLGGPTRRLVWIAWVRDSYGKAWLRGIARFGPGMPQSIRGRFILTSLETGDVEPLAVDSLPG